MISGSRNGNSLTQLKSSRRGNRRSNNCESSKGRLNKTKTSLKHLLRCSVNRRLSMQRKLLLLILPSEITNEFAQRGSAQRVEERPKLFSLRKRLQLKRPEGTRCSGTSTT